MALAFEKASSRTAADVFGVVTKLASRGLSKLRGRGRSIEMVSRDAAQVRRHDHDLVDSSTASRCLWVMNSTVCGGSSTTAGAQIELVARQRIERAERLVHQPTARLLDQRQADRDALALSAGQSTAPVLVAG